MSLLEHSLLERKGVLGICVAYRVVVGAAFALPLAIGVADVIGGHPRSDAVLWEPGGYWLVECARLLRPAIGAQVAAGGVAMGALGIGWLLPLGALIAALGDGDLHGGRLLARAWQRFAGLVLLYGSALVAQAIVMGGVVFLAAHYAGPDRAGDIFSAALVGAGLLLSGIIGMGHDAARVVWVLERPGVFALVNRAFELLRVRPLGALLAAAWRAALGVAALFLAFRVGASCMDGGTPWLALAWAMHVAAVAAYVILRATWLRWLTAIVAEATTT